MRILKLLSNRLLRQILLKKKHIWNFFRMPEFGNFCRKILYIPLLVVFISWYTRIISTLVFKILLLILNLFRRRSKKYTINNIGANNLRLKKLERYIKKFQISNHSVIYRVNQLVIPIVEYCRISDHFSNYSSIFFDTFSIREHKNVSKINKLVGLYF